MILELKNELNVLIKRKSVNQFYTTYRIQIRADFQIEAKIHILTQEICYILNFNLNWKPRQSMRWRDLVSISTQRRFKSVENLTRGRDE